MKSLGFQFELQRRFNLISSLGESLETYSSVDTWCMCFNSSKSTTKECLCYHKIKRVRIFQKKRRLYVYLLPILQIFFNILINKHAIINLFLIHKRKKTFFSKKSIFSKPVFLLHNALNKKLIYKMLGLKWFKTQEASRAAITFLKLFHILKTRRQCK